MATLDLIDLDRARQNLPSSTNTDEPVVATLITAASLAVQRYCRRDFASQAYDELYNGTGDRRLVLRQYPLLSLQSVRYRPVTVLKVINNSTGVNQQARVSVTGTGLTLVAVASGVKTTSTLTFAVNLTLTALANAIAALGNGWSAQVIGDYSNWPSADLYCPNGPSGAGTSSPDGQGALTAWGQNAELRMHTYELAGYQFDQRRGWLLRAIPYTDPELLHPEDLIWPVGVNNFRVQYSAGYAAIPEDVQEATAELVATWFQQRGRDLTLQGEAVAGVSSYSVRKTSDQLPDRIRAMLRPYRYHRIFNNQG